MAKVFEEQMGGRVKAEKIALIRSTLIFT